VDGGHLNIIPNMQTLTKTAVKSNKIGILKQKKLAVYSENNVD
jgi:hypothetical protein